MQGVDASDQIIRALRYFNEKGEVQIIAILRGGGSADDLACFNDEALVREIAASKIPVITGIGHEVDESLADLAADIKASTPSNVAQMLTPDKSSVKQKVGIEIQRAGSIIKEKIDSLSNEENEKILRVSDTIQTKIEEHERRLAERMKLLSAMDPERVLQRGYAILRGKVVIGNNINIVMAEKEIKALVKEINER